jgi:hypothetical protein
VATRFSLAAAASSRVRWALARAISADRSAARSVLRSKRKFSVGTVWMDRRLNSALRSQPAASLSAASLASGLPSSTEKCTLACA